jgi:Terminase large subunit, T4likevirus-type, N-terminal
MAAVAEPDSEVIEALRLEYAKRLSEIAEAKRHPGGLLDHVQCVDAKTGERFSFTLNDPEAGWFWQRDVLDEWMKHPLSLVLKARQIGITWLAAGYALWKLLTSPGTRALVVSINEDEAIKVVNRIYDMFMSLPEHLRFGADVTKPSRDARPSTLIELTFPDGRISSVVGLPSTRRAGHGETATIVLLDEYARHEYARESWKATFPTADNGGQILIVSTANGVSNEQTGEGNFFHHLYVNAEEYGIETQFLAWDLHPDRDENWYLRNARALPPADRAEQFPRTPEDAFINTGECWFDLEALAWYADNDPLLEDKRMRFHADETGGRAKIHWSEKGWIRVYAKPDPEHSYAIGADVATGRGFDYSAAYVIDLTSMAIVAELHAKPDADEYAEQLHFLGRWYGTARIAVETQGGYGESVIASLRDGRKGRPSYPTLYRHTIASRPDAQQMKNYGFPTNTKTRPLLINQIEQAIRERTIPALPRSLIMECRTFVRQKTNPSPRALDGSNDDRVMAFGIALEMYRLYGRHEKRVRRSSKHAARNRHMYPWERKRVA